MSSSEGASVLVTGAAGLLGSNLALDFASRGLKVLAVDRDKAPIWPGVRTIQRDLADGVSGSLLLEDVQPAWVIHCAAATNVDWCQSHPEPTRQLNVEMPRGLAATARQLGCGFVYISTDSVFDGQRGNYCETDPPAPLNVYAHSKRQGEIAVLQAHPGSLLVRTNIYGWTLSPKLSLAGWILHRLRSGVAVPGFQDVIFSPILVNDLGDCLLAMLERRLTGVYHVAGGEACSKYEFALSVANIFRLDRTLVYPSTLQAAELRAARPKDTSLNTSKVSTALGRPMPSVAMGLQRFRSLCENGHLMKLTGSG